MRKYLLVIGVPLFLLSLISLNTLALTASQIGASQIVNTYGSSDWAGVAYSVEWKSWFTNYWAVIPWASETIYIGNLTLGYIPYSGQCPDVIGIWVGLSPAQIGYGTGSSSGLEQNNFIQAGYGIFVTSQGRAIQYFVMTYVNGQNVYTYEEFVPAGHPTYLNVFLENLENGTALAQFFVYYANGTYWTTKIYTSIPWQTTAAMSMVEAPTFANGITAELPSVHGGMIHFSFAYVGSDGNEHIGPSNSNTAGTIYADVYNLNEVSAFNSAQAQIYNGWANTNGGWNYVYEFYYPGVGNSYGL
jgi:hypothetical protein